MAHTYQVHIVDSTDFSKTDIGDEYAGGILVDGTCDGDTNELLLITRHETEAE